MPNLTSLVKSIQEIMSKDAGTYGDATLVKGFHGTCPKDRANWPVFISPIASDQQLTSTDVHHRLLAHFR